MLARALIRRISGLREEAGTPAAGLLGALRQLDTDLTRDLAHSLPLSLLPGLSQDAGKLPPTALDRAFTGHLMTELRREIDATEDEREQLAAKSKDARRRVAEAESELSVARSEVRRLQSDLQAARGDDPGRKPRSSRVRTMSRKLTQAQKRSDIVTQKYTSAHATLQKIDQRESASRKISELLQKAFNGATDLDRLAGVMAVGNALRDIDFPAGDDLDSTLGLALARTYAHLVGIPSLPAPSTVRYRAELFGGFLAGVGRPDSTYTVPPELLAERLWTLSQERAANPTAEITEPSPDHTDGVLLATLGRIALPIFTRQKPITAGSAMTARLLAVYLAWIADTQDRLPMVGRCREIAAAVTLLESRWNGSIPASESIVLAVPLP